MVGGAYCAATAAATLAWALRGGPDLIGDGRWVAAIVTIVVVSLPAWFVVAGIGLRIVRAAARRRIPADQPLG